MVVEAGYPNRGLPQLGKLDAIHRDEVEDGNEPIKYGEAMVNAYSKTAQAPRYSRTQRLLHWALAFLILLALMSGGTIGVLGFDGLRAQFGPGGTDLIYTSHKTLGVLILAFMLVRLGVRILHGRPAYVQPLTPIQRVASSSVHALLYLLLLAMPVLGWLATAAGGFPVHLFVWELPGLIGRDRALSQTLFFWHQVVGILLLTLISAHIAAALYHWRIRKDGVMQRISLIP